jgi:hypothetical protein
MFFMAHLERTSFSEAHLDRAEFFEADLSEARSLDLTKLDRVFGDASTKLPDGIERPTAWPARKLSFHERLDWVQRDIPPAPKA